jgi:hypothetical protein
MPVLMGRQSFLRHALQVLDLSALADMSNGSVPQTLWYMIMATTVKPATV